MLRTGLDSALGSFCARRFCYGLQTVTSKNKLHILPGAGKINCE